LPLATPVLLFLEQLLLVVRHDLGSGIELGVQHQELALKVVSGGVNSTREVEERHVKDMRR
jgi:hypothetical protein